jgi:hypothetical protein
VHTLLQPKSLSCSHVISRRSLRHRSSLCASTQWARPFRWKSSRVGSHSTPRRCSLGITCLCRVPARVVERPRLASLRWKRRRRSAVAALMESSCLRHSKSRWRCPCRVSRFDKRGEKGHEAFGADAVGGMPDQEQCVLDLRPRLGVGEGAEGRVAPLAHG